MQNEPADDTRAMGALDLGQHRAKRHLLATVLALNGLGIEPSKAQVCRAGAPNRRESGMRRSRWYRLLDELCASGYATATYGRRGCALRVTDLGKAELDRTL